MPVAVEDPYDTFPCEEHVGKSFLNADKQVTLSEEKRSLICTKQTQTIENLLPDEEDLFSGVLDELGYTAVTNSDDEDLDLFSSNGGIELEENSKLCISQCKSLVDEGLNSDRSSTDYIVSCEHPSSRVEEPKLRGRFGHMCFTTGFPSTVRISSAFNQFGHMPYYYTDQAFYAQSLPISCEGVTTYDSLNSETVDFTTETYDKNLHMLGTYGSPNGRMFWGVNQIHIMVMTGSTRMARSALGENTHDFSCSNSFQNHHLDPVIWSNCPPLNNNVCVHTTSNSKKCSFINPKGRGRRISRGRHGHASRHTVDKKFELDIESVLRGEDSRTTLMIKNIPNRYSSAMLLAAINEHNQGTYDFIYLPIDFKNKCNMGYAFINMTDPLQIVPFHKAINGKKWENFHSEKVAYLAYARIQGKDALIANFQESGLMSEDKCCHPILFTTSGPNAGSQEPFPLGPNIHSRRHKNRCNAHRGNENQDISSTP